MFKTIDEALAAYKKAKEQYAEWLKPTVLAYIAVGSGGTFYWNNDDYQRLKSESAKFSGMENVLGLTDVDIATIDEEVGMGASWMRAQKEALRAAKCT